MTAGLDAVVKQMLADRLKEAFPDARFDECDLEGVALALQQNLAASPPDKKLFGAVNCAALDAHNMNQCGCISPRATSWSAAARAPHPI